MHKIILFLRSDKGLEELYNLFMRSFFLMLKTLLKMLKTKKQKCVKSRVIKLFNRVFNSYKTKMRV